MDILCSRSSIRGYETYFPKQAMAIRKFHAGEEEVQFRGGSALWHWIKLRYGSRFITFHLGLCPKRSEI